MSKFIRISLIFKLALMSITILLLMSHIRYISADTRGYLLDNHKTSLPNIKVFDYTTNSQREHYVRFGVYQMSFLNSSLDSRSLWQIDQPEKRIFEIKKCVQEAINNNINILIFPELTLNLPEEIRNECVNYLKDISSKHEMIIVGGSFYDENRFQRSVMIGPDWIHYGYKFKPSKFEVSPLFGEGMVDGEELTVLKTKYGNYCVIICADLISDQVQYCIRYLSTRKIIDGIIVLSYNPSSLEFLIEANCIVRRHPIFLIISNICIVDNKNMDYGHTAILSHIKDGLDNLPNSSVKLLDFLPGQFIKIDSEGRKIGRELPYSNLIYDVGPQQEGMLIFEINLDLINIPYVTNAPDQGYKTIGNIEFKEYKR